ncbi:MAG: Crp/Fnr family transcriptional regulator [Alphaproteobacteria bacterium]|nr:Crp/Fnr family transcriptional regulator [Alphaproteobacteria bacterium]
MDLDVSSIDALAALPLFQGVEPALLQGLLATARFVRHEKGAVFLAQDQPVTRFYVVVEGWCAAAKGNAEGQETILQIFRRGDFLPEPDRDAGDEPSPLNLLALTPCVLLMLPPSIVRNALDRSPAFAANMLAAAVRRSQELRDHIEQLTLRNAEQRIGRFLLQVRFGADQEGKDIVLPFDKSHIASYLGIKPETLSRTLQFFKENGFVVERNHLIIPDRQALCDYCDSTTMKICRFAHGEDCVHSSHGDAATL